MASYEQALKLLKQAVTDYKAADGAEDSMTALEAACGLFATTLVHQLGFLGDPTPEERADLEALSKELDVIWLRKNAPKN